MADARMESPKSRWELGVTGSLLVLNAGLFLWAMWGRLSGGNTPDHSTAFVCLTGALLAQSVRDFVTHRRLQTALLIVASALLVTAIALLRT